MARAPILDSTRLKRGERHPRKWLDEMECIRALQALYAAWHRNIVRSVQERSIALGELMHFAALPAVRHIFYEHKRAEQ